MSDIMYNNDYVQVALESLIKYFENKNIDIRQDINYILSREPIGLFNKRKYRAIIKIILSAAHINDENDDLLELLSSAPTLKISTYKKMIDIMANDSWEIYKYQNDSLYNNLFDKIDDHLVKYGPISTIKLFELNLKKIAEVMNINYNDITKLIFEYYKAMKSSDIINKSNKSLELKNIIRRFNLKSKQNYIDEYCQKRLDTIKKYFTLSSSIEERFNSSMDIDKFIKVVFDNPSLVSMFKLSIFKTFGKDINNKELSYIISNIIQSKDNHNLMFFGINNANTILDMLQITKSYNRLNRSFLNRIQKLFNCEQIAIMNEYLKTNNKDKKKMLKLQFTSAQISLLETIRPIMIESYSIFATENQKIIIISQHDIQTTSEEQKAKQLKRTIDQYNKIKQVISKFYFQQCRLLSSVIQDPILKINKDSIPFTDNNYHLEYNNYLLNFVTIANIVFGINQEKIALYTEKEKIELYDLLVKNNLLAASLATGDSKIIINLINSFPKIYQLLSKQELNIEHLPQLVKTSRLSSIIDTEYIKLLGEEVAQKIAFDTSFLQGINTKEQMQDRLQRANIIMLLAQNADSSAIPYFRPIIIDNIKIERYNNDNPNILTSGIDSKTCFKICGNDNDYLIYSILNKNGMVVRFMSKDTLIGRMTAHRFNNVLLINGIMTADLGNDVTLDTMIRNEKLISGIELLAQELFKLTKDSTTPIDYVISNKSGILESPVYNDRFILIPNYLFDNPIDCYNDDFEQFRALNNKYPGLLMEAPLYEGGRTSPFTTDFGHYPIVLIASRENKLLTSLKDIALDSPEAIYKRPKTKRV